MTLAAAAVLAAACAWLTIRPGRRTAHMRRHWSRVSTWARASRFGARRRRARARTAIREALADVAADVRAGQPPTRALERALQGEQPSLAPLTLAAVRWGGDVAVAMRADGVANGVPLMNSAAACWTVSHARGAGLADALDRLIEMERRSEEVRRQLAAHLAAPRATARMLALLPVLGIALGIVLGGEPLAWLLGTALGWGCLVGGVLLTGLGLAWTGRIAARTEALL